MLPAQTRIFVYAQHVDMRRSFDALAECVRGVLHQDPEEAAWLPSMQKACSCKLLNNVARTFLGRLVGECGNLCYSSPRRREGTVGEIHFNSWGFIGAGGASVLLNLDSVYGPPILTRATLFASLISRANRPRARTRSSSSHHDFRPTASVAQTFHRPPRGHLEPPELRLCGERVNRPPSERRCS